MVHVCKIHAYVHILHMHALNKQRHANTRTHTYIYMHIRMNYHGWVCLQVLYLMGNTCNVC